MYHTGLDPLHRLTRDTEQMFVAKGEKQRRLHKAFLRYHDPDNWPMLREALKSMGRADLIGNGKSHLIPATQPVKVDPRVEGAERLNKRNANRLLTQHTGLPIVHPKSSSGSSSGNSSGNRGAANEKIKASRPKKKKGWAKAKPKK
jgi:hypothetical protein